MLQSNTKAQTERRTNMEYLGETSSEKRLTVGGVITAHCCSMYRQHRTNGPLILLVTIQCVDWAGMERVYSTPSLSTRLLQGARLDED